MQQITSLWASMDARRRTIVLLATLAMFAAVLGLARMASVPSMSLLYSGLENEAAGEVVSALEQRGVAYEVRGGAIFVESSRRDALRMTLASEGLPENSNRGYEILDGLTGFGTTSQMFNAAYWRAKEGELARTIVSHPSVKAARVHIASTGSNPFQRDVRPTASVSLTTTDGTITSKHARALQFLVASAVAGLNPEDVAVIDSEGGLIGAAEEAPANTADDRSDALRQKVERLLLARVGVGNAVVEVSVSTVTRSESVHERLINPESRVAISTETEERSDTTSDQGGGGGVTVASNLPQGDAGGAGNSSSQTSETRERVNYEVSQTEREITEAPGAIKRMTVAVLVNGTVDIAADGTNTFQPRSDEELDALRELVASAVGYNEERGDVITLKTMEFELAEPAGILVEQSMLDKLAIDVMRLTQLAVLALVALLLGLFVIRPLLSRPNDARLVQLALPGNGPTGEEAVTPLDGEIDDAATPDQLALVSNGQSGSTAIVANQRDLHEDPVERLRALIGERQEETVEILRNWLEGEEENA